jgi:3-oxoacyl-(acyl-carrier-protein) synthase
MQALKIYSKEKEDFPCRALDLTKTKNTMVLGEGASMACLESGIQNNALAIVKGYGYATEILKHNISISSDATCFQKSMNMALGDMNPDHIDVIVMHAPGTIKGDSSEFKAIQALFKDTIPALTSNKWKIGHTFGASGALSIELAVLMLQHQEFIEIPYLENQNTPDKIENILVNAVGFGGNAVSILLSKS